MPYTPTVWQNKPSTATPLSAANLNKIETGIKIVSDVVDTGRLSEDALSGTYARSERRRDTTPIVTGSRIADSRLGDGSDGDGVFGTPGTVQITTDKYYDQLRVGPGVFLDVARGCRIFVRGALINNGTIQAAKTNGANAAGATGGLGGGAPTIATGSTQLVGASGGNAGAAGGTGVGAAGTASAAKVTPGGTGGVGGNGGASGGTAGGTGGATGAKTLAASGVRTVDQALAVWQTAAISTGIAGGSGAAGAGDGTNAGGAGGGGGSAGGFLFVICAQLSGSGQFIAAGGNGGNGATGLAGNAAGGGGGGGGGGGIAVVAALDSSGWLGTVSATGGTPGTGGAGVGTGSAGTAGTSGSAGIGLLLGLSALDNARPFDVKPIVALGPVTTAPLQPGAVVYDAASAPVRFYGGPVEARTYGGVQYVQSGLQTGNGGWNGPSGGGGFWFMEYLTDAPIHEIRLRMANGKYRLKVDGEWVNDTTVLTYTDGGARWLQVSFSKARKLRHFEWYLNQAPFAGIAVLPVDTLYAPTERRDVPTYILGDSFTEGAVGLTQGATDHFRSWAYQMCDRLGWDHPIVDGEGGTGYINDSGIDAPAKKVFPQRITDNLAPLPAHLRPGRVVVAGGFNDPTNTQTQKDAFAAAAALTFSRIAEQLPGVPVWVVMFVNVGNVGADLQARRDLLRTVALAAPNVVAFIDPITGTVTAGPACTVTIPNDAPTTPWLTGTGNISAPNGTGNSDFYRSADLIHPSPDGHAMLASRMESAIRLTLPY